MTILIKGYFKFSKIKEICAKAPDSSVSESILKSAAGLDMYFTSGTCRDAWNAVVSACARAGWYRTGGWIPRGGTSNRCATKNKGDVLGVCATFGLSQTRPLEFARTWLYCDRDFEKAVMEEFFEPDQRLGLTVKNYGLMRAIFSSGAVPGQGWLDEFCAKTHDPVRYSTKWFGRTFTEEEALELAEKMPGRKAVNRKWALTMLIGKKP